MALLQHFLKEFTFIIGCAGLRCCLGVSPAAAGAGWPPAAAGGLLTAGLLAAAGPRGTDLGGSAVGSVLAAPGLESTGSPAALRGLTCPRACGVFLDQGLKPRLLPWQTDTPPLSHQGSPIATFLLQ